MSAGNLKGICDAFRRGLKTLLLQAGLGRILVLVLLAVPLALVLDWWLHLHTAWRLVLLVALVAAVWRTASRTLLRPLRKGWTDEQVLAHVDATVPEGQGMLLDLYELERGEGVQELESPTGRQLAEAAVRELEPIVERVQVSKALHRRRAARWLALAGALLAVVVAAAIPLSRRPQGNYVRIGLTRLFNPFSNVRWPHRTTIELVEPDTGWTVPQMESFTVHARVSGVVPESVLLSYRFEDAKRWTRLPLPVRAGEVRHTFPIVREELRFFLRGGDYTTDTKTLRIARRPFITRIRARYEPPAYAGLPRRTSDSGQLDGLEGTRVELVFESSVPLREARLKLILGDETLPPEPLEFLNSEKTKFRKTLILTRNGSYQIELEDLHGFREPSSQRERYEITVIPDEPPQAEILSPARDLVETRRALIPVAFQASDDFGLLRLEFCYRIDAGPVRVLSDRITGPIAIRPGETVRLRRRRFDWDLLKMKDLPEHGKLAYFVRVADRAPSRRGHPVESRRFTVKLVQPSEFHRVKFEQAKRLLAEALICWREQLAAYRLTQKWRKEGTGSEDDATWQLLGTKQKDAGRAARAMEIYAEDLLRSAERNRMRREFMTARIDDCARLIRRLTRDEHPAVDSGLRRAEPRTAADADPARLKQLRAAAAGTFIKNQKMAVLVTERLLRKLYDWRDLQVSAISASLLRERQQEVLARTVAIADRYIGEEIYDLTDEEQKELAYLGKRQRAIFDAETELEKQLSDMMYKAEQQRRKSILVPLNTAFALLRDQRVNDHLQRAARLIEDNQPDQVLENQRRAIQTLDLVRGALLMAGRKLDELPPLSLDMEIEGEAFDPDPPRKPRQEKTTGPGTQEPESGRIERINPEEFENELPKGTDKLSALVNYAAELQEDVWGRTKFLARELSPTDMPRFRALTCGVLGERQDLALQGIAVAERQAAKEQAPAVAEFIRLAGTHFRQSKALILRRNYSGATRQLQWDAIRLLRDVRERFLPVRTAVRASVEENKKRGGFDVYGRPYLLRGKHLDAVSSMTLAIDRSGLLLRHAARTLDRLSTRKPLDAHQAALEKQNREAAARVAEQVARLLGQVRSAFRSLPKTTSCEVPVRRRKRSKKKPEKVKRTWEVAYRVEQAGAGAVLALDLASPPAKIRSGKQDAEALRQLRQMADVLALAARDLRHLLDARAPLPEEKPAPGTTPRHPERKPARIVRRTLDDIRKALAEVESVPDEVRRIMLRSLEKPLPAKYERLIRRYYESFVQEEAE